jgi:hypothetical protein
VTVEKVEERTVAGCLAAASEAVREAAHVANAHADDPPPQVYERIGALHELAARMDQHLRSCAEALARASLDPQLSSDDDQDPWLLARTAMFRLSDTARERLAGLVAELGAAHGDVSHLRGLPSGEGRADGPP